MRQLHDEPDELKERMIARANEVAEALMGTAKNLEDESTEEERNNGDFCDQLDQQVLQCDTCGWFVETAEICADSNCEDCHKEHCDGEHEDSEEDDEEED